MSSIDTDVIRLTVMSSTWVSHSEHLKAPSPIFYHKNNNGHITTLQNFRIIRQGGEQLG